MRSAKKAASGDNPAPVIPDVPPVIAEPHKAPPPVINIEANGSITVETYGTNSFGRPVEMLPTSTTAVLNNLLCRDVKHPEGPPDTPNYSVTLLSNIMEALSAGKDVGQYKEPIERLLAAQAAKKELVKAMAKDMDIDAYADTLIVRSNALHQYKRASRRADITIAEILAVWQQANTQMPQLIKSIEDDTKPADSAGIVAGLDSASKKRDKELEKRWAGTTPQGREIIRKTLYEMKREHMKAEGTWVSGLPEKDPPPEEPVESVLEEDAKPIVVTLANPP